MDSKWWQLEAQYAIREMATDPVMGLSDQEARTRLSIYGLNQLKEKKKHSLLVTFLRQFEDFIIWVLIVAALISGFLHEWVDAFAILAIVILNAIMGFVQEYRAEKALDTLKKLASPTSRVIRQGEHKVIPSSELVPGDIVELEAGDHVPADSRLISVTAHFTTQEASLTGESNPVIKTACPINEKDVPLAERSNIVYMGTSVTSGKARALVIETGMQTELGRIADMIQDIEQEITPLQKKLEHFGKQIVFISFAIVGLVFLLSVLRGGRILDVFLMAISLAVAAIPEGLPAVVTIALTLGVQKMVKRNALIRKLPSVETLGSTTVICSDKTGTLTKNEMTVKAVFADGRVFKVTGVGYDPKGEFFLDETLINPSEYKGLHKTLLCGTLCNSSNLVKNDGIYRIIGDPTEGAILTCAAKIGLWKNALEQEFPFINEIPFDSERKMMTVIRKNKGELFAFTKGAPDVLLNNCAYIEEENIIRELTDNDRKHILQINNDLADQALRVLAVAYKTLNENSYEFSSDIIEKELTFVGLVAMIDLPREEVREAIKVCRSAGIKTIMITGDHKNTAIAIARDLGFFEQNSLPITGVELDKMDDNVFERQIERIPVYARVSPENKLRIVRTLKKKGEIVAMTGDGINDAPAVKEADIGIAMGRTGTDVTKEVSDMVITDDNFASIVAAVEEGRGIYDNIKKFIHYLLSCNVGEILVMFVASLIGMPMPLLAIQILWINLVTDGLPALALGIDPIDPNIMQKPRRDPNEPVITKESGLIILVQGAFIALCTLFAFGFVLVTQGSGLFAKEENIGLEQARTAAFVVLVCSELFRSFSFRSMTESVFKVGFFANMKLIYAVFISFFLQILIVYIPFLQTIFKTKPLGFTTWTLMIVLSSLPFWSMELMKVITRNRKAT